MFVCSKMHFYKKKIPIVKIQTMSVLKQDGAPPSKFIVRNPCRPPATTTCHHHCFNRHHCGHFFKTFPTFCLFKISAPLHILVCALIYLPYLPVNLRHIFHQIPHIQLVPMCSNLHCCTYNNFSHKILHRIFHALFCRFLQNLQRVGSNALQ